MAATSRRICSTGRSARPVTNHVARPTTSTRKGTATASTAPTTWVVCLHLAEGSCNEHEVHLVGRGCRFGDQDEVVAQLDRQAVDDAHLAGLHRRDRRLTLDVRARRHDSSLMIEDLDQRLVDIVGGEPVESRARASTSDATSAARRWVALLTPSTSR